MLTLLIADHHRFAGIKFASKQQPRHKRSAAAGAAISPVRNKAPKAFHLIFPVIGIGGHLFALPLGLSGLLASLAATVLMIFDVGVG